MMKFTFLSLVSVQISSNASLDTSSSLRAVGHNLKLSHLPMDFDRSEHA